MPKITTLQLLDPLKVFLEFDTTYGIYVAQCLQTGHLVTADESATAKEMIQELLEDEIALAVGQGDFSTLLSNPAPVELWLKFQFAAQVPTNIEKATITVRADIPQKLRMLVGQQQAEVATELKIATGNLQRAA